MNDKYQSMKQTAGALSSLSCSLILLVPLLIILCCSVMFVWSMITGGK